MSLYRIVLGWSGYLYPGHPRHLGQAIRDRHSQSTSPRPTGRGFYFELKGAGGILNATSYCEGTRGEIPRADAQNDIPENATQSESFRRQKTGGAFWTPPGRLIDLADLFQGQPISRYQPR